LRVGKVINQYKVAKHFDLAIGDNAFAFTRKHDRIAAEAALDGIYIIRTSVSAAQMDAPQCVRNYKSLANVERAFRSLKTIDLKVRPIHHRTAKRVRAHPPRRHATARTRTDRAHPIVDRNRNADLKPSSCRARSSSLRTDRNFRLGAEPGSRRHDGR